MRNLVSILVLCVCLPFVSSAQTIPNGGFETWSGGAPVGWFTSNLLNLYVPVTQSTSAHGGSFAVQGTVIWVSTGTSYAPILVAGTSGGGFPISSRPGALHGWYKFSSDTGDSFSATVGLIKNGTSVGAGIFFSATPRTVYTEFVVNITYISGNTPDTATVYIIIANTPRVHLGSTFTVDDLSFGSASDVKELGINTPVSFALEQNFPNPFNPTTKIQFQIAEPRFVTLKVYNLLGEEVATLVNEQLPGGTYRAEFDAGNLPTGTYIYRLQAGEYSAVKKMIVVK